MGTSICNSSWLDFYEKVAYTFYLSSDEIVIGLIWIQIADMKWEWSRFVPYN